MALSWESATLTCHRPLVRTGGDIAESLTLHDWRRVE